jgi:hypothetical protein
MKRVETSENLRLLCAAFPKDRHAQHSYRSFQWDMQCGLVSGHQHSLENQRANNCPGVELRRAMCAASNCAIYFRAPVDEAWPGSNVRVAQRHFLAPAALAAFKYSFVSFGLCTAIGRLVVSLLMRTRLANAGFAASCLVPPLRLVCQTSPNWSPALPARWAGQLYRLGICEQCNKQPVWTPAEHCR